MNNIYVFLIRNDIWIYIVCGIGIFWFMTELLRARRILRRAVFGLEYESGRQLQARSLTYLFVFSSIIAVVFYVNDQIRPTLPPGLLIPPTPTVDLFRTPLTSPTPLQNFDDNGPTPTSPLAPTVTLAGSGPAATDIPAPGTTTSGGDEDTAADEGTSGDNSGDADGTPAPPTVAGCSPLVNFTSPADGATVFGSVTFLGNANGDNFAFYKVEISGPETNNQWASLLGQVISQPVVNGLLGSGNFNGWQAGRYSVRLAVVDQTSNEIGACTIQINIRE